MDPKKLYTISEEKSNDKLRAIIKNPGQSQYFLKTLISLKRFSKGKKNSLKTVKKKTAVSKILNKKTLFKSKGFSVSKKNEKNKGTENTANK